MRKLIFAVLFLSIIVPLFAACGSSEPQNVTFDLQIDEGSLVDNVGSLVVKQGDTVTLRWNTNELASVHLHGYDIEKDLSPDEIVEMVFIADATGKFAITLHTGGSDHTHEDGESCVATVPAGEPAPVVRVEAIVSEEPGHADVRVDLDNFVLGQDKGHWHVAVDGVALGMFYLPEATVPINGSGTHEIMVTLSDAEHCEYDISAVTTVTVEDANDDHDDSIQEAGDDHDGEEETVITSLEVHPR